MRLLARRTVRRQKALTFKDAVGLSGLVILGALFLVMPAEYRFRMLRLFPARCSLKELFGIACPTCGLGRAFVHLSLGDLRASWEYHPGALLLTSAAALWLVGMLFFQRMRSDPQNFKPDCRD